MADRSSPIQFEDIPLEQARHISRGPRMAPELYHALKEKIQTLSTTAARMALPEGTSVTTMKSRIRRVAADIGMPVTIRHVPRGLLFWRSTDEDLQQAKEMAERLQGVQRRRTEVGPADAGVLQYERVDRLDKRRGEDTLLRNRGSDGPRLMAGLSVWQQPCREERCDAYASLLLSAP